METIWLILILAGIAVFTFSDKKKRGARNAAPLPPTEAEPELADEDEEFEAEFGGEGHSLPPEAPPAEDAAAAALDAAPIEGAHEGEGESDAEHSAHLEKIAQAEARCRAGREAEAARIERNRQRLRDAVIMREVLDKPVSLRARRR